MQRLMLGLAAAVVVTVIGVGQLRADPAKAGQISGTWEATGQVNNQTMKMVLDLSPSGGFEARFSDTDGNQLGRVSGQYNYALGILVLIPESGKEMAYSLDWIDEDTFNDGVDTYHRVK